MDQLSFYDWTDNRRDYSYADDEAPCLLCQRPVKRGRGVMVGLSADQSVIVKPENSTSFFPIGPECYRKHKEALAPFVAK